MAINERLIDTEVAAAANGDGAASAEQGLILHLDANDVDSYDGDGDIWYDISEHDVTIPLSDNADDLELHLNASDSTSYGGSGTTWTDLSGNSNNGTISSGIVYDIDNGGYFDLERSSSHNITVSDSSSLDITTNITLEAWINEESVANYGRLFWKSGAYALYRGTNGWTFLLGSTSLVHNSGIPSTGTWYHIAATYDGSNQKLYINGVLVDTESMTGSIPTNNNSLYIGGIDSDRFFDGKIGQVRIYSKALSASEVGQNYRHGRDYIYTDLVDDTNLALHFDAADLTSAANTTWTDKVASLALTKSGTVNYDDELGDFIDFGGGYYGNDTATTTIKDSNADFTIEFWYNFDALSGTNGLLGIMQDASNRGLLMYFDGSTMDVYNYKDGTMGGSQFTSQSWSTLGISAGKWYHITHVIDASASIKTYVDGVLKATSTSNAGGGHWTAMDGIRIGDIETLSYGIDGKMGQFRIYKGLLSADEVMQNYLFTKNKYPNTNHGTITGASWDDGSGETPEVPYFTFDGSGDKVATTLDLSGTTGDGFSISTWFRMDTTNAYNAIFGDSNIVLWIAGGNITSASTTEVLYFYQSSPIMETIGNDTLAAYADDNWHQLTVTCAGTATTDKKFYVDGVAVSMQFKSGQTENWTFTNLQFGQAFGSTYNYNGDIAEVKVFDKALSSSEVVSEFNNKATHFGLTEI